MQVDDAHRYLLSSNTTTWEDLYAESIGYTDQYITKIKPIIYICSLLSLVGSSLMISFNLSFCNLRTNAYKAITYMAVCNIGLVVSFLFGFPYKKSQQSLCIIQGFIHNTFQYSQCFWAFVITFLMIKSRYVDPNSLFTLKPELISLFVCFCVPLVLSLG